MYVQPHTEKQCTRSIRGLNVVVVRAMTFQVTHCRFGVVKLPKA
jgi:hypothetical protein